VHCMILVFFVPAVAPFKLVDPISGYMWIIPAILTDIWCNPLKLCVREMLGCPDFEAEMMEEWGLGDMKDRTKLPICLISVQSHLIIADRLMLVIFIFYFMIGRVTDDLMFLPIRNLLSTDRGKMV
jgi:hypothetical protein